MPRPARPSRRFAAGALLAALAAALLLLPAPPEAAARPQHRKFFNIYYKDKIDKELMDKAKCHVCHEPTQKSNKFRNPYGMELAKILKKNEKDEKVFIKALKKVEEKKSCVEEKTYGDLIKDGKLPAEGCPPVKEEDGGDGGEEGTPLVPVPDPSMN